MTLDGEYTQLGAMMSALTQCVDKAGPAGNIEVVKFSASCSKTQQPADVSPSFMIFKRLMKTEMTSSPDTTPLFHDFLENQLLRPIEKSSRDVFLNFLDNLPAVANKAFTFSNVAEGFKKSGFHPFSIKKILAQCTTWGELHTSEAKAAIAAVDTLAPKVATNGQLTEKDLNEVSEGVVKGGCERVLATTIYGKKVKSAKPIEQRPLNHRRAVHISHSVIMAERARAQGVVDDDDDDEEPEVCVCVCL